MSVLIKCMYRYEYCVIGSVHDNPEQLEVE